MRGMTEREKGLETAFVLKEEQAFWIAARRNRQFGLWAARKLELEPGEAAETYIRSVIASDFEIPGDEDVIAKVRADLAANGLAISDAELRAAFTRAAAEAAQTPVANA
jgi:hypothetical protein